MNRPGPIVLHAIFFAAVCVVVFLFNQTAAAQPGLVSYWPAQGTANDVISNNNGAAQAGVTYSPGYTGQAFNFDGISSDVLVGNPTSLKLTYAISISAWIKPVGPPPTGESLSLASIVTKWSQTFGGPQSDSFGIWLANDNGTMRILGVLHHAEGDDFLLAGVIQPDVFTHVAMTFESTTGVFAIYVNGQIVATHATHPTPIVTSDHNIMIGKEDSYRVRPFRGLIDEVKIFDRALSFPEIQNLADVVAPPSQGRAYVTNGCSQTISVIDLATKTVIATIPIGAYPESLSVSPNGARVFTVNPFANTVTVIDTSTNTVIAAIPVGIYPTDVKFSPDSTRAYVTDYNTFSIHVIDTATNTEIATIVGGSQFLSMAVTPDGTRAYATNYFAGLVSVIDLTTNSVIATIPGFSVPTTIEVTPDGTRVYVVNQGSDTVSVIDTATNTITATIPVGGDPVGIKLTPDGTRAYVVNNFDNTVSVIDTATNFVTQTITGFNHAHRLNISTDGTKVFVANFGADTVSIIDVATNSIVDAMAGFSCPFGVAISSPPNTDSTPPEITPTVSGTLGNNGWYVGDVNVSWSVIDGESAVSSSTGCISSSVLSDTSGVTFTCSANSLGGGAEQSVTIKRDATAPVISVTTPAAGATYLLNQSVIATYSCSDLLSATATCSGTVASGSPINTSSIGAKAFTVNSADYAGNVAVPTTVNYSVAYGVTVLYDQTKAHKSGSTVPIKIRLVDANGVNVSSASTTLHAVSVVQTSSQASTTLDDSGNSNPDFDFRYDTSFGGYIFNLKTTGYGTGSYLLNFVSAGTPTVYSVGFQVRQ